MSCNSVKIRFAIFVILISDLRLLNLELRTLNCFYDEVDANLLYYI